MKVESEGCCLAERTESPPTTLVLIFALEPSIYRV